MILTDENKVLDDSIKANQAQHSLDREQLKFLHYHLINQKNMNIWQVKI